LPDDWQVGNFGLYIHWPFCQAKCPYCDFNSHVVGGIDQSVWISAYIRELDRVAIETSDRVLNTVFFGGGTPSLMYPDTVGTILSRVQRLWPVTNEIEITLEANPGSVEAGRFAGYRDAGVNRVSMGVQAFSNADLRRLGRLHSAEEAIAAFGIAQSCFDRVSFDLIYARQGQTPRAWAAELEQALSMAVDHLSLYQLTIEDGTAFGDRYRAGKLRDLPDDHAAAEMYQLTRDICDSAGYAAYEVSNHAISGGESRHNQIYWRCGDYLGIGPGAHGRVTLDGQRYATETQLEPDAWLADVKRGSGEASRTPLSRQEQAEEFLMMGLRLVKGIDTKRFTRLAGRPLSIDTTEELSDLGLVQMQNGTLRATPAGHAVLNGILRAYLID